MRFSSLFALAIPLLVVAQWQLGAWNDTAPTPCGTTAEMLVTDFPFRTPVLGLPRVEVKQCRPEESSLIQIVAWTLGGTRPALVIDTGDFGVVQAIARANVFVVETGGATRDQVFAIVYEQGRPRLAVRRTTRGTAVVTVGSAAIEIDIGGIYAGDARERRERQQFKLDSEQLRPH